MSSGQGCGTVHAGPELQVGGSWGQDPTGRCLYSQSLVPTPQTEPQSHEHTQIQTGQSPSQASARPAGTMGRTAFQLPEDDHLELWARRKKSMTEGLRQAKKSFQAEKSFLSKCQDCKDPNKPAESLEKQETKNYKQDVSQVWTGTGCVVHSTKRHQHSGGHWLRKWHKFPNSSASLKIAEINLFEALTFPA